jgi:putative lipoprotein
MHQSRTASATVLALMIGCQSGDTNGGEPKQPSDSPGGVEAANELHVEVFYRERMLLPPGAQLTVTLEDAAKMDVAAETIAEKTIQLEGGPPYRVTLQYDPSKLTPQGRYGVRARVQSEGRMVFASMEHHPAFGIHGSKDEPVHDPVEVLVRRASTSGSVASLTETRWALVSLRGEPAGKGAGDQSPSFTLSAKEQRISGFAGCNQMTGTYQLDGDQLSFSKMAMTMRACPEGMDLEREVTKVLDETRSYEISGGTLRLRGQDGVVIAELKPE